MKLYSISYDLATPGQNYPLLSEAIKAISGYWCKPLLSLWFVQSTMTAMQIAEYLKLFVDKNDKIVVTEITTDWATYNAPVEVVNWLRAKV